MNHSMCNPEATTIYFVVIYLLSGYLAAVLWDRSRWAQLIAPVSLLGLLAILAATGCDTRFSPVELILGSLAMGLAMNLAVWVSGFGTNRGK